MAQNKPNAIKTIIEHTGAHWTRSVARSGNDYSNISDFLCSCGQKFIGSWDREPPKVPSLSALHKADTLARALGLADEAYLALGPGDLLGATTYSTIIDDQGVMLRRTENNSEPERAWYTQNGDYRTTTQINYPARVIWAFEL